MSNARQQAMTKESTARFAKTKINRIDQVIRKANESCISLKNIKDQMVVLVERNLDRANDDEEMRDLFAQMDKQLDLMEHL